MADPKDMNVDLKKLVASYNKKYTNNGSYRMDPIAILELTKAMMSRGVEYEVAEQIIVDFHKRMERF